ncbi:hypothetical protein QLZ26_10110 [Cronobacter universalis]|uniref:hypothetical protein n=1 Tax=Cronobacter universalis TaxID=535744 RepID=UPI0024AFA605|nr:hypothetical protein [Cronobacter universalis]MDI7660456.1 hypothetical protein [Cronobacter universalis]
MSDDLSRMGEARVVATLDETGRQVIEKSPVDDVEYHFYHHAARQLAGAGVETPALLAASPAIDLAPLIKGMGTRRAFVELAERYNRFASRYNVNELARDIALAKAWIVTEVVILLHARQKAALPRYLNWYRENLPDWLTGTINMV